MSRAGLSHAPGTPTLRQRVEAIVRRSTDEIELAVVREIVGRGAADELERLRQRGEIERLRPGVYRAVRR